MESSACRQRERLLCVSSLAGCLTQAGSYKTGDLSKIFADFISLNENTHIKAELYCTDRRKHNETKKNKLSITDSCWKFLFPYV